MNDNNDAMKQQQIMDRAARYLSYKPRTRQELRRYLREHGADERETERCLAQLEEYHLIDDAEYARMYIESMLQQGRGLARIRRELQGKGVGGEIIEDVLHQMEEIPDESEQALAQAEAMLEGEDLIGMEYPDRQKLMARIAGRLGRKGYQAETVYSAVRTAFARREAAQRDQE